jgi:hypothetical protein
LILEVAADLFSLSWSPAAVATMTELELTAEEQAALNGARPQLGELLLARGELDPGQLDAVLERVFGEVQGWSDRLSTPPPAPVPRELPEESGASGLEDLVVQLTGLLDLLVAQGPVVAAEAVYRPGDTVGPSLRPPREETAAPAAPAELPFGPASSGAPPFDDDQDAMTVAENIEAIRARVAKEAAAAAAGSREDEEDLDTIHLQSATQLARGKPRSGPTLQVERPAAADDDPATIHIGARARQATPREEDEPATIHLERAPEEPREEDEPATIHLERAPDGEARPASSKPKPADGDTLRVERAEVS